MYKFSNPDNNRFVLFFRKDVYPYEFMNDWERFNETLLPKKEDLSCLRLEDTTDTNCTHTKRVRKDLEKKI